MSDTNHLNVRLKGCSGDCPKPKVIVSRKVCKFAISRNKLRRRIREILRDNAYILCYDITVITHRGCGELTFNDLKQELENSLVAYNNNDIRDI